MVILNFGLIVFGLILLFGISERWWLGTVLTYAPRAALLIPGLILLPFSLFAGRAAAGVNAVSLALTSIPIMEFQMPLRFGSSPVGEPIRVLTCNVQRFKPDFDSLLAEIVATDCDLVVLQEAKGDKPQSLLDAFDGWHVVSTFEFWIASRDPVVLLSRCQSQVFNRESAIAVEVQAETGSFVLVDVHLVTARHGLLLLKPSTRSEESTGKFRKYQKNRAAEAEEVRKFIDQVESGKPTIVAGDLNLPASSYLFRRVRGDFTDAFAAAGWGYGQTAPNDGAGRLPAGWPWIRVDHILTNDFWHVESCQTGKSNGSDHKCVWADLILRPSGD